jgi:hypothetical protein
LLEKSRSICLHRLGNSTILFWAPRNSEWRWSNSLRDCRHDFHASLQFLRFEIFIMLFSQFPIETTVHDEFTKSVSPNARRLVFEAQAEPKFRESIKAHSARCDTFSCLEF